jgi:aryl-alcohol dehydrogenase-like predicted oxidoreductase
VRRIAFGCEQLGGYEWGLVDTSEVAAAIELAIASGVNLFDTADCYGRGESERRLGAVLKSHRDRVLIATKFGVRFTDAGKVWYDSSPAWATQALDESLARLGVPAVDLLQMHYWDGVTPLRALFDQLELLRERQKIRWYGVTNYDGELPPGYAGLVSASLEYSLVQRTHEERARRLAGTGISFLAYGSLGQGILSGKYGPGDRFEAGDRRSRPSYRNFHGAQLARNTRIVSTLCAQAQALGLSASQLAIAWILHAIPGSVALVGIKRATQLRDVVGALGLSLPADVVAALDAASTGAARDAGAVSK